MTSFTVEEKNQVLDDIIESRRTIRKFKSESPPRTIVEKILQAGLLAPFARISVIREDFRKFFVIPRESEVTSKAVYLIKRRSAFAYEELEKQVQQNHIQRSRAERYLGALKIASQEGPPNLGKAPYYVVVAEQRGIPEVAQLSLAHCLENMWLKATVLGLAFQLLSVTERMSEDKEFCELIGVPFGDFALDGCLIGYPDVSPTPSIRSPLGDVTKWL